MPFLCRSGELIVAALFVAIAHFDLMGEHNAHEGQRNKGHNEANRGATPIHAPRSTLLTSGRTVEKLHCDFQTRSLARSHVRLEKTFSCFPRGFFPSAICLCTVQTKNKSVAYDSSETGSGSFFFGLSLSPPPTPTVTRRDFCNRLEFNRDSLYSRPASYL